MHTAQHTVQHAAEATVQPTEHPANARASTGGQRVALLALNAALLIAIGAVWTADARAQAAARGRGDYTMLGGEIQGANSNALYVIDAANQEMVALRWDDAKKQLIGIGYRDLRSDAQRKEQR